MPKTIAVWSVCRECRHVFRLDEDREKAFRQARMRLCPMHAEIARVEAAVSSPCDPGKTRWA